MDTFNWNLVSGYYRLSLKFDYQRVSFGKLPTDPPNLPSKAWTPSTQIVRSVFCSLDSKFEFRTNRFVAKEVRVFAKKRQAFQPHWLFPMFPLTNNLMNIRRARPVGKIVWVCAFLHRSAKDLTEIIWVSQWSFIRRLPAKCGGSAVKPANSAKGCDKGTHFRGERADDFHLNWACISDALKRLSSGWHNPAMRQLSFRESCSLIYPVLNELNQLTLNQ